MTGRPATGGPEAHGPDAHGPDAGGPDADGTPGDGPATPAAPAARDERAAWVALFVIVGSSLMVALDTTIVNVALHEIAVDLGAGESVEWVVSSYLLAVCVSQPATGWLADRFGRKVVYLVSLVAFTAASVACALAPNLGFLVAARALQGLGGGALMPVGMAMLLGLFPKERHGRAIGVWGLAATTAPAVGPTLGGWLATSVSWHWLFLVNLPVGAVTLVSAARFLPEVGERHQRPFDVLGLVLGCGGLSLAVLGLSEANSWGWRSAPTVAALTVGALGLAGFVRHELRVRHPMIDLRMFADRSFRLAMAVLLLLYVAHFGRLVFLPLELEGPRGYSALLVGTLFFPAAVCSALAMSIGGRIADRIGPRLPIVVGSGLIVVSTVSFARLTLHTPLVLIGLAMCVHGVGFGLVTPAGLVAGLSELPSHLVSQGTAVRSLLTQASGAIAVAVLGAVVAASAGTHPSAADAQASYNNAFVVAAAGVVVALALAVRLPDRRRDA